MALVCRSRVLERLEVERCRSRLGGAGFRRLWRHRRRRRGAGATHGRLAAWVAAATALRGDGATEWRGARWGLRLARPEAGCRRAPLDSGATAARARHGCRRVASGASATTVVRSRRDRSRQAPSAARASPRSNPRRKRTPQQRPYALPRTLPHGRSSASPARERRIGHAPKNSAPRFVGEPGALQIQAFLRRESVRFSAYENHESSALPSQAVSCFSASSLAMP